MQEKDILTARSIQENKQEIVHTIKGLEDVKQDVYVVINNVRLGVRAGTLKELLDKELNYANRRLKSLGVTEIT